MKGLEKIILNLARCARLVRVRCAGLALVVCAGSVPVASQAQVSASPQRFEAGVAGCLARAEALRDAGNFAGVMDQLGFLCTSQLPLSPEQEERCAFLLAEASYNRDSDDAVRLLEQFAATYPASRWAEHARLLVGDRYFFSHEWPDAVEAYNKADFDRLNRDDRLLYTYRKALAMIKTGYFREARRLVSELRGKKGYEAAFDFYDAYLDYIDGDFKAAYRGFSRVPQGLEGMDADFYMTQIEYSRGEYRDVVERCRRMKLRGVEPELEPELHRVMGMSHFKLGQRDDAGRELRDYLRMAPDAPSAEAVYALGSIEYEQGDYTDAAGRFASLTDHNDEIGQGAWLYLGQCYQREGNAGGAILAFEKAARQNYDAKVGETALYNYVTAVTRGGKVPFSSSSQLLQEFVDRYPDSEYAPEVESYLATAYYNDREYAKALRSIDNISNPSAEVLTVRQKVLYALGVETMTNGEPARAITYLQQAARSGADREVAAQASLWLGDALYASGRYKEARAAYETFVRGNKSRSNRSLGYYNLAYTEYKLKDYAAAATDFGRVDTPECGLPERLVRDAELMRADCLYYTGRYAEAKRIFGDVVAAGGDGTDYALYRRSILYGLEGDRKAKLADLKRVENEYPESRWLSQSLLEQAHLYEEMGRDELAADAYKKRLGTATDVDMDELLRMADAMHSAGRSEDLLEVTARIRNAGGLEADELADISLYEADALADMGRTREAEEIYRTLAQTPSSLSGSKASVALAESMLRRGDYAGARDLMEEFTGQGTPHAYWLARGFVALADAYKGLGETSLAREYLVSLRENYPGGESDIDDMITSRLKKWK